MCQEEGLLGQVTLTTEPGVIGGVPCGAPNFGAAVNVAALLEQLLGWPRSGVWLGFGWVCVLSG